MLFITICFMLIIGLLEATPPPSFPLIEVPPVATSPPPSVPVLETPGATMSPPPPFLRQEEKHHILSRTAILIMVTVVVLVLGAALQETFHCFYNPIYPRRQHLPPPRRPRLVGLELSLDH
ncbi:hypothetical protein ACFE04_025233 [Oxalis oulophora]